MEPRSVSVIIPAYNAAQYLRYAIESVLAQTYRNYEIIVVDDGSTDNTGLIAREFGCAIQYVYQKNQGLAAARNTGIRHSGSEIIALLDADDSWQPEFLEVMIDFLEQNPESPVVYCGFQYIDSLGANVGKPSLKVVPPEEFLHTQLYSGNWLSACAVLFRKELAEKVGLFDESLRALEDADLWIRLSALGPIVGLPQALVNYRRHGSNMSKDPQHMITAQQQVVQKNFGPALGDIRSWPSSKVGAYRAYYRFAAIRFLASKDVRNSAHYLRLLVKSSMDSACRMELWRSLVRATVPDEYQFDDSFQLNWDQTNANIEDLLRELTQKPDEGMRLRDWPSRIRGSAFLALADEAGRNAQVFRAFGYLLRAVRHNPRISFTRPYWGTMLRSLTSFIQRVAFGSTAAVVGVWLLD